MKYRRIPLLGTFAAIVLNFCFSQLSHAAALTWDANNGTTGAQDGSGTWTTGTGNWLDTTSSTDNANWTAADTATFGAGSDGTYSVTLGGTITTGVGTLTTGGLNFANSGYTLSADSATTITLGTAESYLTVATGKSGTIGANVTVGPTSNKVINISGGGTLSIVNGGTVRNNAATSSNLINILNSTTVNVETGGSLASTSNQIVIGNANGSGTLVVDGGSVTGGAAASNIVLANNTTGTVSGELTVNSGAVTFSATSGGLRIGSTAAGTGTSNGSINLNGGTLEIARIYKGGGSGITQNSTLNFNGGTIKTRAGSTVATNYLVVDNAYIKDNGATIDTNGVATTIGQALQHDGTAATDGGLTKIGSSILKLSGVNSYTGTTTVNAGTIQFAKTASLYNDDTTSWTASNLIVKSGGALSLNVGGSGEFTTENVTTILSNLGGANGTSTTGFAAGSAIGFDTTNASDGTFTVADNIANSTGTGGGSIGFFKYGAGTLILSGANTYSGTTTISGGNSAIAKLMVSGTGALTGAGALQVGSGTSAGRFEYTSSNANTRFSTITLGSGSNGGFGALVQSAGTLTATTLRAAPGRTAGNSGNINLSGGTLRITGTATIGEQDLASTPSTITISDTGLFQVDTGLKVGIAQSDTRDGNGIFTQDGGTVTVAGGLTLAGTANTTSTRTAIYNLNGGTLNVNAISMANTGTGTNTSTFNFNGGTLKPTADNTTFLQGLTTANVKDGGAKIDTAGYNITIGQNLLHFAGTTTDSLTKDGLGTLTLTGANTYIGNTFVTAGTLSLGNGTTNTGLADGAEVFIDASAVLNLNFLPANTDIVNKLTINGIQKAAGTWGASGSGATNIDDTHFSGPGTLTVTTPPVSGFSSWIDNPTFGLSADQKGAAADPDNDGIENLLEFVLNGNPSTSDSDILPDLVVTATHFEFTFPRHDDSLSLETTQTFQYGSDLENWTSIVVPAVDGIVGSATITVTNGSPADTVKVSIPKSTIAPATKLFGRLQVVK